MPPQTLEICAGSGEFVGRATFESGGCRNLIRSFDSECSLTNVKLGAV